jgi:hypothetical protein
MGRLMTQQQTQATLRWWIGTLLVISLALLSGVVWAVRQEGRINGIDKQHETDIKYIREDIKDIKTTQHQILEKL